MPKLHVYVSAAALLMSSSLVWTLPGHAGTDTQTAEDGGVYRMPAGDSRTEADYSGSGQIIPQRSATPDAELMRLKSNRAATETRGAVVAPVAPVAQPRALFTECVTNAATGFGPSDIHGAATPTNLVVVTNVDISVRNKTNCALISGVSFKTFFNNFTIPASETLFDPRVLY